jgi:hypothetical protein
LYVQYSQRHSMINHCNTNRHITLLSVIVILIYFLVCLIYLLFFICLLGDTKQHSLYAKEFLKIYLIEQKIYPNHQDEWYVYHSDLLRYVSDCTVTVNSDVLSFKKIQKKYLFCSTEVKIFVYILFIFTLEAWHFITSRLSCSDCRYDLKFYVQCMWLSVLLYMLHLVCTQ